jgi:tetratricopeptide (TPR) repeat protein
MSLTNAKGSFKAIAGAILMLLSLVVWSMSAAAQTTAANPTRPDANPQICDVNADLALGQEDYPAAIVLHRRLLQAQPNNALAHYHLGFAYSMTGRSSEELTEYLTASHLGLQIWDLYLNLGLAYLGQHQLERATEAFATSVTLGTEHAESHFNLALAYESANQLSAALREIETARRLAPQDPDVANTNAIICVELGDRACAHDIWTKLTQLAPNYAPARANLQALDRSFALNNQVKRYSELSFAQTGANPATRIGSSNLQTVTALNDSFK